LTQGVGASRILPTICVHRGSVVQLSFQASYGKAGHGSTGARTGGCMLRFSKQANGRYRRHGGLRVHLADPSDHIILAIRRRGGARE
jgi:hypothetical protein